MSVWLCIPSAREVEEVTKTMSIWRSMGYRVCLQRDPGAPEPGCVDKIVTVPYDGYSLACNRTVAAVREVDPEAEWFICAGDDTLPDPLNTAEVIAAGCRWHFTNVHAQKNGGIITNPSCLTFGVMQPTGDRWGDDAVSRQRFGADRAAYIDRVAGSAWIGLEFIRQTYGGNGPMWPGYWHMFNDEELYEVANKLGVYWMRRDLTHYHAHCQRNPHPGLRVPGFLTRAYSKANWTAMESLFKQRKAAGFPGAFERTA